MKALPASSIGQYDKSVSSLGDYSRTVELGLSVCFHAAGPSGSSAEQQRERMELLLPALSARKNRDSGGTFFADRSSLITGDDVFSRLLTFPKVIVTGHQAFFTRETLENIARTTLQNIATFETGTLPGNEVLAGG